MDAGEISPAAVSEVFRGLILLLAPFAPFLRGGDVGADWR